MRKLLIFFVLVGFALFSIAASGRFLIIDEPRKSDAIVVLGGDNDRPPAKGLELLSQGFAPRLILDVPARTRIYQWNQLELAQQYVKGLPQAAMVTVCPIYGLSTRAEAGDVARCLQGTDIKSLLIVTSDFHTRRSLSIFRHALKGYDCSVAAAFYEREFGAQWWRDREWAKTNLEEWEKLVWWEVIERWH